MHRTDQRTWSVSTPAGAGPPPRKSSPVEAVEHPFVGSAEQVVACPGRVGDTLSMGAVNPHEVEPRRRCGLDVRHGVLPAVRRIVERTHPERRVLLFSAMLNGAVATWAVSLQRRPVRREVGPAGRDTDAATHASGPPPGPPGALRPTYPRRRQIFRLIARSALLPSSTIVAAPAHGRGHRDGCVRTAKQRVQEAHRWSGRRVRGSRGRKGVEAYDVVVI